MHLKLVIKPLFLYCIGCKQLWVVDDTQTGQMMATALENCCLF